MTEVLSEQKRELWYDGPNYTADAVIIDPEAAKILLIERGDGGGWALPGGFIDPTDASGKEAAIREAKEEATITIEGKGQCIFKGIVDDPRNSDRAWIETEAYLFCVLNQTRVEAQDDAINALWYDLAALPPLYASHQIIIDRALDALDGQGLSETLNFPEASMNVNGGHMQYDKFILEKDHQRVFCKQYNDKNFSDSAKATHSKHYLEKEAALLSHLRTQRFQAIPEQSTLFGDTLAMTALTKDSGWKWRADQQSLAAYVDDTLMALDALEAIIPSSDVFPIEASYESFRKEGWQAIDEEARKNLTRCLELFSPKLHSVTRHNAQEMLVHLDELQYEASQQPLPDSFVFCHHDIRQSNVAWHPLHKTKLVDWSWAGYGEPGSDATSLLIDLHKSGQDISPYLHKINPQHCLTLMGFWLIHSTWPHQGDDTVRFQQFVSAVSAYEIYRTIKQ